ncbi:hypothetical protein L1274_000748 [Duganella sp. HSC-15S17]|uniref:Uncharacterized protein n=1 Tax=Duganella violaceipulchra TaxID=2849652 RepID=A0ABT1GDN8_9BURK|nr:hypothetical protein [Duganella violaceicalia]
MDCKKEMTATFINGKVKTSGTYDFGWLNVRIDITGPMTLEGPMDSTKLQEIPIRTAIAELQKLLTTEGDIPPGP